MKKHLLAALAIFVYILFAWATIGYGAEGTRILRGPNDFVLTIPEQCPDFLSWAPRPMGLKKYENGNQAGVILSVNPDETVIVRALWVHFADSGKTYCIALIVEYLHDGRVDFLEDLQFMQTGKPSGKLTRAKDLTPFPQIERFLNSIAI